MSSHAYGLYCKCLCDNLLLLLLCLESEAKNPFFSRILRLTREGLGCKHILCSCAYSGRKICFDLMYMANIKVLDNKYEGLKCYSMFQFVRSSLENIASVWGEMEGGGEEIVTHPQGSACQGLLYITSAYFSWDSLSYFILN